MFDNCIEVNFIPKVIVLCGNFTTRDISPASVRDAQKYQGDPRVLVSPALGVFEADLAAPQITSPLLVI